MAVRFDAAADRLARTSGLLNTNAAYTASFWIYLTSDLNAYEHVFGTNINSAANNFEYVGFDDNNVGGTLPRLCLLVDNGAYVEVSGSRLALSTWHYIAVIRSSTTNLSLYLNGGTTADVTNTQNVSARTTATRMELGAFGTGNGDRFDGRIANLKIWNTNLTAQEAADERFTVEPLRKSNLWGWYPLLSSSDIADWSGNGRDWTAGGTLTTEDHPPRPFTLFVPQMPFAVVASAGSITGDLAQTLANVTVSAAGTSGVSGTLAATLDNVTVAATGTLAIAGTAANTLANVTSSAAGAVALTGALSQTLGNVTVSAAGASYQQYALRFYNDISGGGRVNRVIIPLEDGASTQYPVNVGAGDFCVEFHMRAAYADNSTEVTDVRYSNIIYDRDDWGAQRGHVIGVTRRSTDLVVCFGQAGSGLTWSTIRGTVNVGDDAWHHVAITRNQSTGLVRIWVDGVIDTSATYDTTNWSIPAGHNNTDPDQQDSESLVIGFEKHDVGVGYNGQLDELRISDALRYTATFTPERYFNADADTVGLYRFDEGSGTTAEDSSGNNTDGTLYVGGSPSGPVYVGIASGTSEATLSATLGNVTSSAAGAVALQASLAQTLGNVTVASAGVVAIAASASNTLGNVTVSAAGVITIEGELSATLGDVTVSATGESVAEGTGSLSQTLGNVTVASTGTIALAGALAQTLDNVTSSAAGTVAITGALAPTLADVTVSASGVLIDGGQGALVATLGNVTSSAAGTLAIAAAAANTLDSVTVSAVGRVALVGSLSATLGAVTVAAVGTDVLSPTPENRIYRVPDEERVYQVSAESRVYTVE